MKQTPYVNVTWCGHIFKPVAWFEVFINDRMFTSTCILTIFHALATETGLPYKRTSNSIEIGYCLNEQ